MRVVIGEDSALFREGLAALLRSAGHEVVATAADGESVLREVVERLPDVAVLDVRMPPKYTVEGRGPPWRSEPSGPASRCCCSRSMSRRGPR